MSKEVYELDFDGHVKAIVKVESSRIEVFIAINGYGEPIPLNRVRVTAQEREQFYNILHPDYQVFEVPNPNIY